MTGHAYATSARTAARMGPFAGYAENAEHMLRVLRQHREAAAEIDEELVPAELLVAPPSRPGTRPCELGRQRYGVRNSPGLGARPHRHHRPDDGLRHHRHRARPRPVKMKKLVGGGTMSIVNQTVPRALRRLGYTPEQIDEIVAYIDEQQVDPRRPAPAPPSTCRCSPARWATTPSTTRATCG